MHTSNGDPPVGGGAPDVTLRLDSTEGPGGTALYRPGETLTGRVRLRLASPLTVRNLDLLIQGSASVSWGQGGGHFIRDDEIYVNDVAELVPMGLDDFVTLSAGEHVFPFACHLPTDLPATFTGSFGSVAYTAKAVLQAAIQGAGGPWVSAAPFVIETLLPVPERVELLRPCVVEARMQVGGARGRCVKALLSLPRRIFAAQQELLVTANVSNRSRKTISRLTAALVMDCQYLANGGQEFRESLLVAERSDDYRVGHMEGRCWKNVRLRIPRSVPPTGLPHCRLINVSYSLLFRAEVENCPKDLNLRVPIVVGVSPFESTDGATSSSVDGADSVEQPVAGEPEVMRRMSRAPSVTSEGTLSRFGGQKASLFNGELEQSQRPGGSTQKQLGADYHIFDPAAASPQPKLPGASEADGGPAHLSAAATGDSRFLPTDFYAPSAEGEGLY